MKNNAHIYLLSLILTTVALAQSIDVTPTQVTIGTTSPATPGAFIKQSGPDISFSTQDGINPPSEGLILKNNGNIGIGVTTPATKLELPNNTAIKVGTAYLSSGSIPTANYTHLSNNAWYHNVYGWTSNGGPSALFQQAGLDTSIYSSTDSAAFTLRLRVQGDGNVGIGTANATHKLTVNGQVKSRGFITDTSGWSDYIFDTNYKLPTLAQVEQHIADNGHLPGIPSEKEVLANGINLGDMQAKLLAQIEQLTLHMIAHEKAINSLKAENAQLRQELKTTLATSH